MRMPADKADLAHTRRDPARSVDRTPTSAPDKALDRTQGQALDKAPDRAPVKAPDRVLGVVVCRVVDGLGGTVPGRVVGLLLGGAGMVRSPAGTLLVGLAGTPWARVSAGGLGLWGPSCWWWLRWRRPG